VRASDLIEPYPTIDVSAPAEEAARLIGREQRPALLVLDGTEVLTVLPAAQVVRLMIPPYLRDDPSLVAAYDEAAAEACLQRLTGRTVGDLLGKEERTEVPVVEPDATALRCATLMASTHSPLVVVTAGRKDRTVVGVITASRLLDTLLP
jgi:CBS domain-containing protein